jgi:hypothetical protein
MVGQVNGQNGGPQRTLYNNGSSIGSGSNALVPGSYLQDAQRFRSVVADLAQLPQNIREETLSKLQLTPVELGNILRNLDKSPDVNQAGVTAQSPSLIAEKGEVTSNSQVGDTLGVSRIFGADVAAIVAQSPSLTSDLKALEQAGWTIVTQNGGGSYCDSTNKTITVDVANPDAAGIVQTLAHEVGHATYTGTVDTSSREAYIASMLANEGAATLNNIKVQREILANGGPDIGIAGQSANHAGYNAAYDDFLKTGDLDAARAAIGAIFGYGETTSNTGQTYHDYYGSAYDKHYGSSPAP